MLALCAIVSSAAAADFYVSPDGSDANPGTEAKPFKTLEAARNSARKIETPVTIILREGTYVRGTSFELDGRDSYTTYKAATGEKVRVIGGRQIPVSLFKPVTDKDILKRLPDGSQGKVFQADLSSLGIEKFSSLKYSGHLLPWATAHSELFFNSNRMELARYPNGTTTRTGKAVKRGTTIRSFGAIYWTNDLAEIEDHIGKPLELPVFNADKHKDKLPQWKEAKDIWINIWGNEYADINHKISKIDYTNNNVYLAQPVNYGLGSNRVATFFNLLEEIDSPGEWYLDR